MNIPVPSGWSELATTAKHYLDKLIDAPLEETGGLLADKVNYWRFKNRINTVLKARAFLESKGIDPKAALPGSIIPLLEKAGDTDDETLQSMFSTLLASHVDPAKAENVHRCYAQILAELDPLDAQVLNGLYRKIRRQGGPRRTMGFDLVPVRSALEVAEGVALRSFQNLWRLGLCDYGNQIDHLNRRVSVFITAFGWDFMASCAPDAELEPAVEAGDNDRTRSSGTTDAT